MLLIKVECVKKRLNMTRYDNMAWHMGEQSTLIKGIDGFDIVILL